jgi:hypothetical protein
MTAIETMLGAIENMKFNLRTGFGDSKSFAGGGISVKTQGLTPVNGASPAGWAVISICIIGAHSKKGHGAKFICPITHLKHHLSAILYVDDTDLLHIDLSKNKTVDEVHNAIQASVKSWGNLLIATGGVLQPAKCFYSIISFDWKNGEWRYVDNTGHGDFNVTVPLPGGTEAPITHKTVDHAEKTLGAMTSPDGKSVASIAMMQEKAQGWINAVRGGNLHRCNIWFSLKVQFWPRVGYGLCSTTATFRELEQALHRQYYQILPLGGVIRHTTNRLRILRSGSSTRWCGGYDSHDKQIANAFWLQHRDREVHADIILFTPCGARHVVPTVTGGLQKAQSPRYTLLDEDAMGKGVNVWDNSDHTVGTRRLSEGRGRFHYAGYSTGRIQHT